jgi:hypothetical protein
MRRIGRVHAPAGAQGAEGGGPLIVAPIGTVGRKLPVDRRRQGAGLRSYRGVDGFREFSHRKAIFSQMKKDIGPLKMLRPPFGPGVRKFLDGQIKA